MSSVTRFACVAPPHKVSLCCCGVSMLTCALPRLSAVFCVDCSSCCRSFRLVRPPCCSDPSFTPDASSPHSWKPPADCWDDDSSLSRSAPPCLLRLWPPRLVPYRVVPLSVVDCAVGNGEAHRHLGLLLTGTTSARSVSTRSKGKAFLWAMTPRSHKRKYPSTRGLAPPVRSYTNLC